jgi:hypothetical protein
MHFVAPAHSIIAATAVAATTAALTLTAIGATPTRLHADHLTAPRLSTVPVVLTDAWSDLFAATPAHATQILTLALGTNSSFPLPPGSLPLAPVITQVVVNQLIYATQLVTGHGGQIPTEIKKHLTDINNLAEEVFGSLPDTLRQQIATPVTAIREAGKSIAASSNLAQGLWEAPAVFLNVALNSTYGVLGIYGPLGFPLIVRNLTTTALHTPAPVVVLPFAAARSVAPQAHNAAANVGRPDNHPVAGRDRSGTNARSGRGLQAAPGSTTGTSKPVHSPRN